MLERDVESQCDALVERMQGRVVRYSQPRASMQSAGIADREYYILGKRIRFEVKAPDGKLSREQAELLTLEHASGGIVAAGGLRELTHLIVALRHDAPHGRDLGKLFLDLWIARGLRRGKAKR